MSSPIAHGSLMFAIWPVVRRRLDQPLSITRRCSLWGLLLVMLLAPDADMLLGPLTGQPLMHFHNQFSHSVFVGVAAAVLFAIVCRWIVGGRWVFWVLAGFLAYLSHLLIDIATFGRGVQLFWPISDARVSAPIPLFFGVRHSVGAPLGAHLITLVTDSMFGLGVWLMARWWRLRAGGKRAERTVVDLKADA